MERIREEGEMEEGTGRISEIKKIVDLEEQERSVRSRKKEKTSDNCRSERKKNLRYLRKEKKRIGEIR